MEKSSEKLIRDKSPKRNPFNDMLSEVRLTLPKSLSRSKKDSNNVVLQYDPYIDSSSYKQIQQRAAKTPRFKPRTQEQVLVVLPQPQKTKDSSIEPHQKSRSQLISQWVLEYMEKEDLLGSKWQAMLQDRRKALLSMAFWLIKNHRFEGHYTFRPFSRMEKKKLELLVDCLNFIEQNRKKAVFENILNYNKELSLFGLSNTIEPKEAQAVSAEEKKKQIKGSRKSMSIDGKSQTEDLSNLILNQAKLNLEANTSLPSIPRALKNSQKKLSTARDLGDLSLSTNKQIKSVKKLQPNDLPLDSNKNLPEMKPGTQKEREKDSTIEKVQGQPETPITITYILKNMDLNNICLSPQSSRDPIPNKVQKKQKQPQIFDFINRVPITESFYEPAAKLKQQQPIRNPFQNSNELPQNPGKRSISMDLLPCGLRFHSPERLVVHQSPRIIRPSDYYPHPNEGSFRDISKNMRQYNGQTKPRAHSATPKIRFTFTSSQTPLSPTPSQSHPSASKNEGSTGYDKQDCVKEGSSFLSGTKGNQPSINSLPRNSKVKSSKVFCQQRQHIKEMLLPSPYQDYYPMEHCHKQQQPHKVPMLSNSQASASQAELGLHSYQRGFGVVSPSGRAKSPRDKLLVTCSNRER